MEHSDNLQTKLAPYLQQIDLNQHEIDWPKLEKLCELWLKFGRSMNLSGARNLQALLPHVAEGLHGLALLQKLKLPQARRRWLDVGSGAGFPALILLSSLELEMTLIEPRENRATFLQLALAALQKSNCRVLRGRLKVGSWQPLDSSIQDPDFSTFSIASARAVFPVRQWLEIASSWLRPGSFCICHMKPEDKHPQGYELAEHISSEHWSIRAYRL